MGELYDILKASGLRGGAGGGGFTPTQDQLDAMNSGIDSTKVEQIATNENNILSISDDLYGDTTSHGEWIQGTISSADGRIDTSRMDRITDETFYDASTINSVTFNSDYQVLIGNYNNINVDSFVNVTTWAGSPITTFSGNYVRFAIKKTNGANISPTDNTGITINFKKTPVSTRIAAAEEKLSCKPNAIFMCRDSMVNSKIPPNSKYAIKATAHSQYDMIRFSVNKTIDGQYVAVHDVYINDLAVNTDGTAITPQIRTDSLSLSELNAYDWGLKYGEQYAGLQVPLLENCIQLASLYNLTVAIDVKITTVTSTDIDNLVNLLGKYSQNAIIMGNITISNMQTILTKNMKLSYLFSGTNEQIESQAASLKLLKNGYNDVYVAYRPMGSTPTAETIALAAANGLEIMYSPIDGLSELVTVGFDKGIKLFECHNIENIKINLQEYTDNLIG